jgi:LPS sulfotransferase NodH
VGVAGRPDDYFWNPPFWQQHWGVSTFPAYWRRMLQEGTTDNGVFGVKMMWDYLDETLLPQLAALSGLCEATPAAILAAAFPHLRYLWLTRRDKIRQGISYDRALETRVWRSTDRRDGDTTEPAFNVAAIARMVQLCTGEDDAWQAYFERYRIQPLILTYEELAASPEDSVQSILAYLGLPWPGGLPSQRWEHQKQADRLTEAWAEHYRATAAGRQSPSAQSSEP